MPEMQVEQQVELWVRRGHQNEDGTITYHDDDLVLVATSEEEE